MERSQKVFLSFETTAERGRPAKGRGKLKLSPLELRKNPGDGLTRLRHPSQRDAADLIASRIPPGRFVRSISKLQFTRFRGANFEIAV